MTKIKEFFDFTKHPSLIFIIITPIVVLFWGITFTIGILRITKDNNYIFLVISTIGFIVFLLVIRFLLKIYNPFKHF